MPEKSKQHIKAKRPDANACVELLVTLVRTPSLSGQEAPVAHLLVQWAQTHGFERSYIDDVGNAVAEKGAPTAPYTLVLLGHMDTVPGHIPVRVEQGILYGRGSVDAKGPLAAFFCAVSRFTPPPHVRVVVVGAVEEESATSRGARHIRDRFLAEGIPAACIIGEPSAWDRVTLGYKGRLLAEFRAEEFTTHTAHPGALGVGDKACQWWQSIKTLANTLNAAKPRAFDQMFPSLREIHTDNDGLRSRVRARVGLRLPPGLNREWLEGQLSASAIEIGGTVTFFGYEPAYQADKHNALVRSFTRAIRTLGGKPGFKLKTGTSDMNVVGPAWQCPIVAYGPGNSALDHTPNEHLHLEEFLASIEVLHHVLTIWSQQVGRGDIKHPPEHPKPNV